MTTLDDVERGPDGTILAVSVADLSDKAALLAAHPSSCFTIPHFDNYPAVLVHLARIGHRELRAVITEGWLAHASAEATQAHHRR